MLALSWCAPIITTLSSFLCFFPSLPLFVPCVLIGILATILFWPHGCGCSLTVMLGFAAAYSRTLARSHAWLCLPVSER